MRPSVAFDVLEATYDTASDDASWLARIAAAFKPLQYIIETRKNRRRIQCVTRAY